MNYSQVIQEIESFGMMPQRAPSLEPMRRALSASDFASQIDPSRTIVVAGTNGKGTTCATLETLLRSAGKRVGLYTSPHLIDTTERIRIDGRDISRDLFVQAYLAVRPLVLEHRLSHFEALTLLTAWLFYSGKSVSPVEYAILEVGLGGSWDATNAIPHHVCGITALGLDHEALLGSTLASIARNKFGIVTPGSVVVHTALPQEASEEARLSRMQTDSRWVEAIPYSVSATQAGVTWTFGCSYGQARLTLPGERAGQNTALAVTLFRELGFDPAAHLTAISKVQWPGRMEQVTRPGLPCPLFLSGDHNPQGVQSLLDLLRHYRYDRIHLLVGIAKDKAHDGMLELFSGIPHSRLYLTETPFKTLKITQYPEKWLAQATATHSEPRALLDRILKEAHPEDLILVTGSLYLVGLIRSALTQPSA